jgi:hypothetical protein
MMRLLLLLCAAAGAGVARAQNFCLPTEWHKVEEASGLPVGGPIANGTTAFTVGTGSPRYGLRVTFATGLCTSPGSVGFDFELLDGIAAGRTWNGQTEGNAPWDVGLRDPRTMPLIPGTYRVTLSAFELAR